MVCSHSQHHQVLAFSVVTAELSINWLLKPIKASSDCDTAAECIYLITVIARQSISSGRVLCSFVTTARALLILGFSQHVYVMSNIPKVFDGQQPVHRDMSQHKSHDCEHTNCQADLPPYTLR